MYYLRAFSNIFSNILTALRRVLFLLPINVSPRISRGAFSIPSYCNISSYGFGHSVRIISHMVFIYSAVRFQSLTLPRSKHSFHLKLDSKKKHVFGNSSFLFLLDELKSFLNKKRAKNKLNSFLRKIVNRYVK